LSFEAFYEICDMQQNHVILVPKFK
jgi:hypothetical protein